MNKKNQKQYYFVYKYVNFRLKQSETNQELDDMIFYQYRKIRSTETTNIIDKMQSKLKWYIISYYIRGRSENFLHKNKIA